MSRDLVTMGETMLRLTPPPGTRLETATELGFRTAGAESNVAITSSRLGMDTAWISKLPDSPLGRRVTTDLYTHGVTPLVTWTPDGRQGTYYIEPGGDPRGTTVVYDRDEAAVTTATPDELALNEIKDAKMFYTSGITPALSETLSETTDALLETAHDAGTTTVFDLNYRSKLWSPEDAAATFENLLPLIDICVAAERDACSVLGYDTSAEAIARDLRDRFGHELVIITRGESGALAVDAGSVYPQPIYEAETRDPVGTGDAFVGGFLAWYLSGSSIADALDAGAATAALKRTIDGDIAVVTREEVERVRAGANDGIGR